ncbi:MAG: rhodanese-like domain-containing protein [Cyclobacteriaceae bacterium]|nr:rhodanese-like domain-containing protein [Cyclobacteriaceae bacterium]
MKITTSVVFLMFSFLVSTAQVENSAYNLTLKAFLSHSTPEVSVAQVKALKDFLIMDAREINEYEVSHIKNSIYVGYDKFNIEQLKELNRNQKIVVYCSVGYRSEKIAEKLLQAGFTDVSNLYGGIFEWVNQGNEVVDNKGAKTDKVHAYSSTWGIWLNKGTKVYDK